jgi:hypothetical protein
MGPTVGKTRLAAGDECQRLPRYPGVARNSVAPQFLLWRVLEKKILRQQAEEGLRFGGQRFGGQEDVKKSISGC